MTNFEVESQLHASILKFNSSTSCFIQFRPIDFIMHILKVSILLCIVSLDQMFSSWGPQNISINCLFFN